MLEYQIIRQNGSAKPYVIRDKITSFEQCYLELNELISYLQSTVKPEYYVINDFYKNEFPAFLPHITKFTIKVRNVTEWEICSSENNNINSTTKIIKLF